MKRKNLLAVLFLCTALLMGGCGNPASPSGTTEPSAEKNAPAETADEPAPDNTEPVSGNPETNEPAMEGGASENGETVPEAAEPEDEYAEKIAQVAGTWYSEDGGTKLVICQDGSFTLNGDPSYAGWLSYTEEDGTGLWENGPRYELYTEDSGRVPEVYFSANEDRPGELAFCEGGGAVAFQYDGPAPEIQTREVRVRAVEADETLPEHDTFSCYEGEYPVLLLFTAAEPVTDFHFLSVSFRDMDGDGNALFDTEELYSGGTLDRPLLVTASFPGDMPSYGFSYVNEHGVRRYVTVSESGYDGSLVTGDFLPYQG